MRDDWGLNWELVGGMRKKTDSKDFLEEEIIKFDVAAKKEGRRGYPPSLWTEQLDG